VRDEPDKVAWMDRYHNVANPLPTGVDLDLEFMSTHCSGWHFLVGNPHTFTGRMAAWCQDQQVEISVSLREMTYVSLGASFWIRGFLSGSEPHPPAAENPAVDDAWGAARREYRSTGEWPRDRDTS
jgi:hypothetical protein